MASFKSHTTKAGKTSYRAQVRIKGHPAAVKSFKRLIDAKRWAAQTETEIRAGKYFTIAEAQKHTFADLVSRYATDTAPQLADGARRVTQLKWWAAELGSYSLNDCTPARIIEARDKLATEPSQRGGVRHGKATAGHKPNLITRSNGTVNRYTAALSHAFIVAVKEYQWIEANPVLRISKRKEPKGRVRFLSGGERDRLLQACQQSTNADLYPVVVVALATGARRGEIMSLSWDRVDLQRGFAIQEDTKNGDRRSLHLSGLALDLLKERSKVRCIDDNRVFPSDPGIHRDHAVADAGIENFRFHDLRHTFASYLAMNGATLAEIAGAMGHRTLQMAQRYAHLSDEHKAGVVERMNTAIFGGR